MFWIKNLLAKNILWIDINVGTWRNMLLYYTIMENKSSQMWILCKCEKRYTLLNINEYERNSKIFLKIGIGKA